VAFWQEIPKSDGMEQRIPNVDLRSNPTLEHPVHFVCPTRANHAFTIGTVERRDRWGKLIPGRRGRTFSFKNGHFFAKTQAEADYCRKQSFIYEEPTEGELYTYPAYGVATRNKDAFQAYLAKFAE
jgi:hypothetical protein